MAIGTPTLRGSAGAAATSVTTGSFTPAANDILIATMASRINASMPAAMAISDSVGLTWTPIADVQGIDASARVRQQVFWAAVGGSPAEMTVTATPTVLVNCGIVVVSVSGISTAFANVVSGTSATGDPSASLFGTPGAVLSLAAFQGSMALTEPFGYAEIYDDDGSSSLRMGAAYDLASPGNPAAWASDNVNSIAIGIELVEAVALIQGTLAATEGADAGAFTGSAIVIASGTLAALEGADGAALSGSVVVQGSLAGVEGADSAALAGTAIVVAVGTLAATESADLAAFTGDILVDGALAATDGADGAALAGAVLLLGAFAATEGADSVAFAGPPSRRRVDTRGRPGGLQTGTARTNAQRPARRRNAQDASVRRR